MFLEVTTHDYSAQELDTKMELMAGIQGTEGDAVVVVRRAKRGVHVMHVGGSVPYGLRSLHHPSPITHERDLCGTG